MGKLAVWLAKSEAEKNVDGLALTDEDRMKAWVEHPEVWPTVGPSQSMSATLIRKR